MHVVEGREAKANRRGVSRWSLGARSCASTSLWRGLVVAIGWASVLAAPSWPQGLDADAARSGSGALANLSHTPEANLFVGGVSTSIPIEVPPNRGGMTPQVALTYSSGAGPSLYGYGWDLLLGRIQRRTKYGLLDCADPTKRREFVLLLPGRTVEFELDESSGDGSAYVEESFFRIKRSGNGWRVWDTTGRRYEFGTTAASRAGNDTVDFYHGQSCEPIATSPLTNVLYTFSWELSHVEDLNGNAIDIEYFNDGNIPRPVVIRYGQNSAASLTSVFEVQFLWAARPIDDRPVTGIGGFEARLMYRLSAIKVVYQATVVRSYAFSYDTLARMARQSFLTAVSQYTGDLDSGGSQLTRSDGAAASTKFSYQEATAGSAGFGFEFYSQLVAKPPSLPTPTAGRLLTNDTAHHTVRDVFDINGDGFLDLVDTWPVNGGSFSGCGSGSGNWNVYLGSPAGFSAAATVWSVPNRAVMCMIRQERVSGAERWTDRTTVDMNGDGIADYVDTSSGTWWVYLGYAGATSGFNGSPHPWSDPSGPSGSVRRRLSGVNQFGYLNGTVDTRGLMDVNGDGLLDFVIAPGAGAPDSRWDVWINQGGGFVQGRKFTGKFPFLGYEAGGIPILGTLDINGDGLRDQVVTWDQAAHPVTFPGSWDVYLNTGTTIRSQPEFWSVPAIGGRWSFQYVDASSNTLRDFFDINGDGLPDLVDTDGCSSADPRWKVVLNRGAGFSGSTPYGWRVNQPEKCVIAARSATQTYREPLDLDGDGLVDYIDFQATATLTAVSHNAGGAWCVTTSSATTQCSAGGTSIAPLPGGARPDLLVRVENGIGGRTKLTYRPLGQWVNKRVPFNLWTVTLIRSDDGMCDDQLANCVNSVSSHTVERSFTYEGAWFDPVQREFRGFSRVISRDIDPSTRRSVTGIGPSRIVETIFLQGRSTKGKIDTIAEYSEDQLGVSPGPLRQVFNVWECVDPKFGTSSEGSCEYDFVWVRQKQSTTYDFANDPAKGTVSKNVVWHQCPATAMPSGWSLTRFTGNVTQASIGQTGVDLPRTTLVNLHTDYACVVDNDHYYFVPTQVDVKSGTDLNTLQTQWLFYDTRGNLARTESWVDQPTEATLPNCTNSPQAKCVQTGTEYDAYGNVTAVIDANGRRTETSYDATHIYPEVVTSPAPFLQKVATRYDLGCGVPQWRTIPYVGSQDPASDAVPKFKWKYDAYCRLSRTALPDEDINALANSATGPHQVLSYVLGAPLRPTTVTIQARERNMAPEVLQIDALGRVIQRNRYQVIDGAPQSAAVDTVAFDLRGNARARYSPFVVPATSQYTNPAAGAATTRFDYDAFNRVTRVTNPNGTHRDNIYDDLVWTTSTADECVAQPTSNCPGGKVTEIRDALGRVVEKKVYEGATLRARTQYTFDELGRLVTTKQGDAGGWNDATRIDIGYDSLGRRNFLHDPDSGSWVYAYDKAGNLLYQDDPQSNQHVQFCYDALNRPIVQLVLSGDTQVSMTCPTTAAGAVGNLGTATVLEDVRFFYDDAAVPNGLGRLTRVNDASGSTVFNEYDVRGRLRKVDKQIQVGTERRNAVTQLQYDTGDHLTKIVYPGGEEATYTYDAVGAVKALAGTDANGAAVQYVTNLTYDIFGRPRQIAHGNGVTDTREYFGADQNFRVQRMTTIKSGAASGCGAGRYLDLTYDTYTANGLVQHVGDARTDCTQLSNTASYSYDGLGRLTAVSGNAAVNATYEYSTFGNIKTKDARLYTYGANTPHQVATIAGLSVPHDANGNTTASRSGSPTYLFDAHDRLKQSNGTSSVSFLYDYAGQRVAAKDLGSSALARYYNDLVEVRNGYLTKYYYAAGILVASQRIQAPTGLAAAPSDPAVRLAGAPGAGSPRLVLMVRRDLRLASVVVAVAGSLLLLVLPDRRKRIVGVVVRRGHAIGLIVVFSIVSLPLPIAVEPAWAGGGGGGDLGVLHYHLDHLGSTQVLTKSDGGAYQYTRYKAYGEVRGEYDPSGATLSGCYANGYCRQFAGYTSEPRAGVAYAGARLYDPDAGMFLTHDPARQFASPYNYVGWNPVNFVDTTGADAGPPPSGAVGPPPGTSQVCFGHVRPCIDFVGSGRPSSGGVTDVHVVQIPNPWAKPCEGIGCIFIANPGAHDHGPSVPDVVRTVAPVAASVVVPGVGEFLDLTVIFGSGYSAWARGLAAVSLIAGVVTAGWSPNVGPVVRTVPTLSGLERRSEVIQRAMSHAELEATLETGLLRGGRAGTHYVSDTVNSNPLRARQRLALPQTPEVRVTMEVPEGLLSESTRIPPNFGMPGGGLQRTATGTISVRVLRIQDY